jgi:uncharacterized membrane protein
MSEISRISLVDTLHLIQLARETALAQGAQEQAGRINPVANQLQEIVTDMQKQPAAAPANSGLMGQEDFRFMLDAARQESSSITSRSTQAVAERNQLIRSMSAAEMTDLQIARQLEISTEEVNLVLNISERERNRKETF